MSIKLSGNGVEKNKVVFEKLLANYGTRKATSI